MSYPGGEHAGYTPPVPENPYGGTEGSVVLRTPEYGNRSESLVQAVLAKAKDRIGGRRRGYDVPPYAGTDAGRLDRVRGHVTEMVGHASDTAQRLAPETYGWVHDVGQQLREDPLGTATGLIDQSRAMRLQTEADNKSRSRFKRFMGTTGGKVAKTVIEMIPSPVGYGPGDIITGLSAIRGKDTLSGEKLDSVDRVINGVAALVPGVPATPLVEGARRIRRQVENSVDRHRDKILGTRDALQAH